MVQIKNRVTGLYDKKGHGGWTDKMHQRGAWGSIGTAKSHVTMKIHSLYENDIQNYIDSDFVILDDNYNVQIEPVLPHVLYRLKEELDHHAYYEKEKEICRNFLNKNT